MRGSFGSCTGRRPRASVILAVRVVSSGTARVASPADLRGLIHLRMTKKENIRASSDVSFW